MTTTGEVYTMVAWGPELRMLGQCLAEPGSYREERWLSSMKRQSAVIEAFTRREWQIWCALRYLET